MKKVFWFLFFMALVVTANAQRIPDLNAISATADDDLLYIVDVSDTTGSADGTGKKATVAQITANLVTGINWDDIGGVQSDINLSGFTNDSGFISGLNWDDIGGTQSDINVSGFTNDSGYITNTNWDAMPTIQNSAINWDDIDEDVITAVNWDFYIGGGGLWEEGASSAIYYNDGNVGIGTSAPSASFEIKADAVQQKISIDDSNYGEISVNAVGGVLIDTTGELKGASIRSPFIVQSATNEKIIGQNYGNSIDFGASVSNIVFNTGIGLTTTNNKGVIYLGGQRFIHAYDPPHNGTANPQGYNTFVGYQAGNFTMGGGTASNTEASYNVGVGQGALQSITTGSRNIGIGLEALKLLTTGGDNVAIGRFSGDAITSASSNILIGSLSGSAITTGLNNTLIGQQTGEKITTTSGNIGVGRESLKNNVGVDNIAVGNSALLGSSSTASSGIDNVAVGAVAGAGVTTGSYNVFVGDNAGRYHADGTTALTDPENSIYLGALSKGKDNNDSNSIVIGYGAISNGANTVTLGATTITSTFLRGLVEVTGTAGLRVTPPAAQTIAAGNTVTADACGSIKKITAAGAVTTDTTDTFTAPAAANDACCMDVINVGAENITLDNNANFISAGAADVVLGAGDTVRVCSTGESGKWYQIGATGNN